MRLFELSGPSGGTGDGGEGETYEDLCRSHIDAMIAAAAAREVRDTGRHWGFGNNRDLGLHHETSR